MVLFKADGFSLLELLLVLCIMGIFTGIAVPSFVEWRQVIAMKSALRHTADIAKYARTLAIAERKPITLVVDSSVNHCISVTSANDCDCNVASSCHVFGQHKRLMMQSYNAVIANPANKKSLLTFDGTHGMSFGSAMTVTLSNARFTGKVIINNLGRVRYCASPAFEDVSLC
ncbi:Prepilin peptidase dependent protein A [Alteromonas sp. 38]|uniref:GspH/FimT family pseudopilin n=1 Tax=Alteromonas TaxID=226 RepID=UPI0012F43331|nr:MULTISPECIES: GspH/FimT family pseudopilin [Alteromonas]CAD5266261.1 Prepilin peptidase dependent protein A [Alteromonas sp. 154]VXC07018.1 Prepilin peptidase dependent protein A [Alteromonas sp. 38]